MSAIGLRKSAVASITKVSRILETAVAGILPMVEDRVSQNPDSSWSLEPHAAFEDQNQRENRETGHNLLTTPRPRGRLRKTAQRFSQTPPRKHGTKGMAEDEEFAPDAQQASPESREELVPSSPKVLAPKYKNATAKRATYVKNMESVQVNKPEPYGQPPVWADKRQQLCETLPYYRAYMSGAYIHDGIARGFMCDKEVGDRDKFDEEIMIARV
jgi:hypothetical protein